MKFLIILVVIILVVLAIVKFKHSKLFWGASIFVLTLTAGFLGYKATESIIDIIAGTPFSIERLFWIGLTLLFALFLYSERKISAAR